MAKKQGLENVLKDKLKGPRVIYLLGGGASFCAGLPSVSKLTSLVLSKLRNSSRFTFDEIVQCLVNNGIKDPNIEEILTELHYRLSATDLAIPVKKQLRVTFEEVCRTIQNALMVDCATEYHREFVQRLARRREAEPAKKAPQVQIFTTNYDLLIELACEEALQVVINGFEGIIRRRWNPGCFDYDIGRVTNHTKTPRFEHSTRHIKLFKLHGSLSWFQENGQFYEEKPTGESKRTPLIIYPSRLKYVESIQPPFDWLFRRFATEVSRASLLISIGYRFADNHLNQYIFAGLENGLSLIVLSKEPIEALDRRLTHPQVSLINEESTVIDGKNRNEITDLWAFEKFAKWLPALKEN